MGGGGLPKLEVPYWGPCYMGILLFGDIFFLGGGGGGGGLPQRDCPPGILTPANGPFAKIL